MLPYTSSTTQSTTSTLSEYIFRTFSFNQLNLSHAITQHLQLLTSPVQFYKATRLHKQIKSFYYRDDPSFNVLQLIVLLALTVVWCITFGMTRNTFSVYNALRNTVGIILIEYIGVALAVAYILKICAERYLNSSTAGSGADVSYAYALDIHFNAMSFIIVILVIVQLLALPVLYIRPADYDKLSLTQWLRYTGAANIMYGAAVAHYLYITWLGYAVLTQNTQFKQVLYYSVAIVMTLALLATLFNFNIMLFVLQMYFDLS